MTVRPQPEDRAPPPLVGSQLVIVILVTFLFFLGFSSVFPVLPRYIVGALGRSEATVGTVFGVTALASVLARLRAGRLGDGGRLRELLVGGAVVAALGFFVHLVPGSISAVAGGRFLVGLGQGAVIVGATATAMALAAPHRQGEAASYVMVAVQGGVGIGPVLGELVVGQARYQAVWVTAAVASLLAAALASRLRPSAHRAAHAVVKGRDLHPRALPAGVIVALGSLGYLGWLALVPLQAAELGVVNVAPLFLVSAACVGLVRLATARHIDRIGPVHGGLLAGAAVAVGLLVLADASAPGRLYLGTVVMSIGSALLFPALLLGAVRPVPVHERGRALATYTMFLDVSAALGPALLGSLAASSSYGATFRVGSGAAIAAVVLVVLWLRPWLERRVPPDLVRR